LRQTTRSPGDGQASAARAPVSRAEPLNRSRRAGRAASARLRPFAGQDGATGRPAGRVPRPVEGFDGQPHRRSLAPRQTAAAVVAPGLPRCGDPCRGSNVEALTGGLTRLSRFSSTHPGRRLTRHQVLKSVQRVVVCFGRGCHEPSRKTVEAAFPRGAKVPTEDGGVCTCLGVSGLARRMFVRRGRLQVHPSTVRVFDECVLVRRSDPVLRHADSNMHGDV